MKTPNIKLNINLGKVGGKSNWQRGIFWALAVALVVFVIACIYQLVKEPSKEIENLIDTEVSSINIIFDTKTIEDLKIRQQPAETVQPTVGKNPFIPF